MMDMFEVYKELARESVATGLKATRLFEGLSQGRDVWVSVLVSTEWEKVGLWVHGFPPMDLRDIINFRNEMQIPYGTTRIPRKGHHAVRSHNTYRYGVTFRLPRRIDTL